MLNVEPIGRSGGLALLWRDPAVVDVLNYSARHICARVSMAGSELLGKFTGFYSSLDSSSRAEFWEILRHLSTFSSRLALRWGLQ
jgi:hypothetical protein